MAKHEITLHENEGATKTAAPYLGTYVSKETTNFEAACPQIASLSGNTSIEVNTILAGAFDYFADQEQEGPVRFLFDGGEVCVTLLGSFASADAAFDPLKNTLNLTLRLDDDIRDSLVNVTPTIVTDLTTTKVRLDNVIDVANPRPYQVMYGQADTRATGINLVMSDTGASVYLQNANGVIFPCTVKEQVSKQEFVFNSNDLLEAGDYKLYVASRGGDAEGPLQLSFRKVKYLHIEPTTPAITKVSSSEGENKVKANAAATVTGVVLTGATEWNYEATDIDGARVSGDISNVTVAADGLSAAIPSFPNDASIDTTKPCYVKCKIDGSTYTSPALTYVS